MIIPSVRQPEYDVQTISQLTFGLDLVTDSRLADPRTLSDCSDILFDKSDVVHRERFQPMSGSETAYNSNHIRMIGSVNGQFYRVKNSGTEYFDGSAWQTKDASISLITAMRPTFKAFFGREASTYATGTTSGTSSSRIISTSGLTENALIGMLVKITSGTGAGQTYLITGNTATQIFLEDTLEYVPAAGVTFEVYQNVASGYVST